MARFNIPIPKAPPANNRCGFPAYNMTDKTKLVTMALTTMLREPKFYGDNSDELIRLAQSVNPAFVSRLAVYVRREVHLRSVSHALCAVVAHSGKEYIRPVVAGVVERADDITEILSAYLALYGKPIPNGLKKALARELNQLNEYELAKYKGEQNELKMRDVIALVHPKPKDKAQAELFGRVMAGTLQSPNTWETQLSARGNRREVWEELIESGQIGYMALLRNLRNILEACPRNQKLVFERLADREAVLRSKQMPFRFYSAYRALKEANLASSKVFNTLEQAVTYSVENMDRVPGKTLIAIDVSGSMMSPISKNSDVCCSDIARLLAVMAVRICEDAVVVSFDTNLNLLAISAVGGILSQTDQIPVNGGGTDLHLPVAWALKGKRYFDRLILLSDNENNYRFSTCQPFVNEYRKTVNPKFFVHAVDLQGYGTQQFIGRDTNIIAGWSENVLRFIGLAEQGMDTLTKTVEHYDIH